jgi:hypothetical protein
MYLLKHIKDNIKYLIYLSFYKNNESSQFQPRRPYLQNTKRYS